MAIERVALRVSKGGHNIPPDVIERRYKSGIKNLIEFIKIVDIWTVYDNSISPAEIIAKGEYPQKIKIVNFEIWEKLKMT